MFRAGVMQDLSDRLTETFWKAMARREERRPRNAGDVTPISDFGILWPTEYEWAPAHQWVDGLLHEFHRSAVVERVPIPQPYPGIVVFHVRRERFDHAIAIDYSDYSILNEECAAECVLYFKMQFDKDGYGRDHVVPGGFVPRSADIYSYLSRLRAARDEQSFRYDVYGRFGRDFATEIRAKAAEILQNQNRFQYEGGLSKVRYSRSLREITRARLCIDLPGNGAFCFRLVDYLAVGACVISYPHRNRLPLPLVDRKHIVYCRADLSDLSDLCEQYLQDEAERERICRASREYFDAHLHRRCLARYYLDHMAHRLSASTRSDIRDVEP
jgi:hypothetical protein